MALRTVEPTAADNLREKLVELRKFHQETLDKLGVPNAFFIGKMAFVPRGKMDVHVSLFNGELNRKEDVFIEFTSRDLHPEDPNRCLYKYEYNPYYDAEYEKVGVETGNMRYLIPINELQLIRNYTIEPKQELLNQILIGVNTELKKDIPLSDMTFQDYIAIHLKVPVSNKPYLNDIINKYHGK